MDIIFIKEVQTSSDILNQVKNGIIARIQQAVNPLNQTQTLILPIVPKGIKFPCTAEIDNYKGISTDYNVPSYKQLTSIEWSSFFPNKPYDFIHSGSSSNGYEYVTFLIERQTNKLPFRLVAIEDNKVLFDNFVLVEGFESYVDSAKDIQYTLKLKEFNVDVITALGADEVVSTITSAEVNEITNDALQELGLI